MIKAIGLLFDSTVVVDPSLVTLIYVDKKNHTKLEIEKIGKVVTERNNKILDKQSRLLQAIKLDYFENIKLKSCIIQLRSEIDAVKIEKLVEEINFLITKGIIMCF